MSVETHLLYAVHGPIVAALLVSEEEIRGNKTLGTVVLNLSAV